MNLTKEERRRRVALLCCHFARNLAYYRLTQDRLAVDRGFRTTIVNNFIDMAVLEWCKLFGDRNGRHYWEKVVTCQDFKADIYETLNQKSDCFASYIDKMRKYRDKFVAHLDDDLIMNIPEMNQAKITTECLYNHLMTYEALPGDMDGLPFDLENYFQQCFDEAWSSLDRYKL